ncbi:prolyl oligopeptidase, partial [Syncephalis pseudoplumigaleata]
MNKPFVALLLAAALLTLLDGLNTLHGQRIADPYRWLENANSTETKAFVEAENKVAMDYLKQDSRQVAYKQTISQLQSYDVVRYIRKKPNYYFISYSATGVNGLSDIYRQKTLNGKQELFIDKNTLSKNGTLFVGAFEHSLSGKFLAYSTGLSPQDTTIRVVCAEDVEDLCKDKGHTTDVVRGGTSFSITWTHDERGFFYTQPAKSSDKQASSDANAGYSNALYYHSLGTQQSQDQLISMPPQIAGRIISVDLSSDGNWLMVSLRGNGTTSLWAAPMDQNSKGVPQKPSFRKLANTGNDNYSYIATHGSRFYFLTHWDKPQSKVVAYDMNAPNDGYVDVLTVKDGQRISSAYAIARNHMLVKYIQGDISTFAVYKMGTDSHVRDIKLPPGMVNFILTQPQESEVFFNCASMLSSHISYLYDFASNAMSTISEAKLPGFDASAFEVRQVSVAGKNGASFPMYIAVRKGIQLDGSHPMMISVYAGPSSVYNWFNKLGTAFMKHFRGVYAVIRIGVSSFDEDASDKNGSHRFQHDIDNIKSASAYLAQHNYTKPALLTVHGTNTDGTAVAAAVNQAPNQFGCALIEESVLDLPGLPREAIAAPWHSILGNPAKKEDFGRML